jgi:hypothetical protein
MNVVVVPTARKAIQVRILNDYLQIPHWYRLLGSRSGAIVLLRSRYVPPLPSGGAALVVVSGAGSGIGGSMLPPLASRKNFPATTEI